jgi:NAD(P)-dependent dehydrogenase (short-subunit alcohol dehydrogenase family)
MSKVWLVTGSSRGLGRDIARAVLENGDKLVATARQIEQLGGLTEEFGDQVALVTLDVTDSAAAEKAVGFAVEHFGRIDVLVNNAGYGTIGSLEDMSLDAFRTQIGATSRKGNLCTLRRDLCPF